MEDEKLAAYYDDLTRRGGGAARFKQGLGFSSNNSSANVVVPARGSALPTTSSLFSSFVRASSPPKTSEFERQAQVQSIQNKLSKKPKEKTRSRSLSRNSIRRSPSRDSIRDKHSRIRSRSRSRSRDRRSRRRSRSRDDESRRKYRSRSRSREINRNESKRRKSPEEQRLEKGKKRGEVRGGGIDYAKLIEDYDKMTPAERVKAKMKLQLSKTAENDETIGKGSGWERFEFNKDAPLDDEEVEAVEDDGVLVKRMGQSFRFSAVQARNEEEIRAAHDEAIFGGSLYPLPSQTNDEAEEEENKVNETIESSADVSSLVSDQVLTIQKKGSWRERAIARARDRGREL